MTVSKLTPALVLALSSPAVMASGFALIEQSASGQGLSYAGAAASTEDASVMWFNPAGLTEVAGSQAVAGMHVLLPSNDFTNSDSRIEGVMPLSGDDNAATNGLVPNLYWKGQYGDYALGFGLNVPYGQKLEYADEWAGRYQSIETDLKSVNLNVNIARKLNDATSIGFGVNAQYVTLNMSQKIFTGGADGEAEIEADSWGYGYNLGLLTQVSPSTKVGLSYRSEIIQNAKGEVDYNGLAPMQDLKSDVTLPATAMFALTHDLNERITLLADATWTGWSAYDELVIEFANGSRTETNQNFKDSMRYALGLIYDYSDDWRFRTGVAFDETPVPNAESRSSRTPDSNKTWLSVGFNYQVTPSVSLDAGYSHLLADKAKINKHETLSPSGLDNYVVGEYETHVDIVSLQMVWNY